VLFSQAGPLSRDGPEDNVFFLLVALGKHLSLELEICNDRAKGNVVFNDWNDMSFRSYESSSSEGSNLKNMGGEYYAKLFSLLMATKKYVDSNGGDKDKVMESGEERKSRGFDKHIASIIEHKTHKIKMLEARIENASCNRKSTDGVKTTKQLDREQEHLKLLRKLSWRHVPNFSQSYFLGHEPAPSVSRASTGTQVAPYEKYSGVEPLLSDSKEVRLCVLDRPSAICRDMKELARDSMDLSPHKKDPPVDLSLDTKKVNQVQQDQPPAVEQARPRAHSFDSKEVWLAKQNRPPALSGDSKGLWEHYQQRAPGLNELWGKDLGLLHKQNRQQASVVKEIWWKDVYDGNWLKPH
jgi:hypothetical protein